MTSSFDSEVLLQVNNEIQNLYDYCIAAGLTHDEIVKKAQPLIRPITKEALRKKCCNALKVAAVCFTLYVIFSSTQVQRSLLMNGRQLLFQVLPWWDWTALYHANCFLYNPYFKNELFFETDCEVCEDLLIIERLNTTSEDEVTVTFLQNDIPVIVSDAISHWPAMDDSFTIANLTEGYLYMGEVAEHDVCMFQTNLRVSDHRELLQKILSSEVRNKWYTHWENCQKHSEKFLRKFYKRPEFLPSVVQMTGSNWLFMSSSYNGWKYKMVAVSPSVTVMWFAQLRGYHYVRLEPKEPCETMCNVLEDTVEEGDIIFFNPTLWNFLYLPGEETENLAIAAEGFSQYD